MLFIILHVHCLLVVSCLVSFLVSNHAMAKDVDCKICLTDGTPFVETCCTESEVSIYECQIPAGLSPAPPSPAGCAVSLYIYFSRLWPFCCAVRGCVCVCVCVSVLGTGSGHEYINQGGTRSENMVVSRKVKMRGSEKKRSYFGTTCFFA